MGRTRLPPAANRSCAVLGSCGAWASRWLRVERVSNVDDMQLAYPELIDGPCQRCPDTPHVGRQHRHTSLQLRMANPPKTRKQAGASHRLPYGLLLASAQTTD